MSDESIENELRPKHTNNQQTRWTNGKENPGDTGLFTELPAGLRQKKLSKGIANCSVRIPPCGKPIDWEKRRTS